jgi:hypothetical protein
MAAFTLLILANPPAYRWQRIAVSTWFEHSAQVCKCIAAWFNCLLNFLYLIPFLK